MSVTIRKTVPYKARVSRIIARTSGENIGDVTSVKWLSKDVGTRSVLYTPEGYEVASVIAAGKAVSTYTLMSCGGRPGERTTSNSRGSSVEEMPWD